MTIGSASHIEKLDEINRLRAVNAELLEALKALNAAFLGIPINVPPERLPAILAASDAARAAIAKAGG